MKFWEIKFLGSICEVIEKIGLKDGMIIFFYYYFCEGDYVMNLVLVEIVVMGLKNILIVFSLIVNVYEFLIEYIKNGVVINIIFFGLRDKVGVVILVGIMENFVVICLYGGWVWVVVVGDIYIDVVFLGVLSLDVYGNVNGIKGKVICGFFGYVMVDVKYVD